MMTKLRFDGVPGVATTDASSADGKTSRRGWATGPTARAMWPTSRRSPASNWSDRSTGRSSTSAATGPNAPTSPVLELASHTAPRFSDEDVDKLRSIVEAGRLLFLQADGGSAEFNDFVSDFARRLFPQYDLVDVPADHPLYTRETAGVVLPRPPLKMVSNGARILLLYSPTDVTRYWEQRDVLRHREAFQLGMNIFVYANGRRDLRHRLQDTWVSEPVGTPLATVRRGPPPLRRQLEP